jgi:8-oxo-dGTP diphosphatase
LACGREGAEELGITSEVGRLLVIDCVPPNAERQAWIGFAFDAGVLADGSGITLQAMEFDAFAFAASAQLRERLTTNTADRIDAALRARATGGVVYLHNGVLVQQTSSDVVLRDGSAP